MILLSAKKYFSILFWSITLFTFSLISPRLVAQQVKNGGLPFIKNYTPEEYNASEQNWAIFQDKRGIMYIGNGSGLLEFDGNSWRFYEFKGLQIVRAICDDSKGRIFIGGIGELGFLETDSAGRLIYHSVVDKIPEKDRNFSDIWSIHKFDNKLYFRTRNQVLIMDEDKIHSVYTNKRILTLFEVQNNVFAITIEKELFTVQEKGMTLVSNDAQIPRGINFTLLYSDNQILTCSMRDGLFLFDGKSFTPFKTQVDTFLKENGVSCGVPVGDRYYALGTQTGGLVIIEKTGRPVQWINKERGLQNNTITALYSDRSKNLWATLEIGVSYIGINSPFNYFGELYGIDSKCYISTIYKDKLYVGGSPYIHCKDWTDYENPFNIIPFTKIEKTGYQSWQLIEYGEKLFCPHNPGVLLIDHGDVEQVIYLDYSVRDILPVRNNPSLLLLATSKAGMYVYRDENKSWKLRNKINNYTGTVRHLYPWSDNNIWVCDYTNTLLRIQFDENTDSIKFLKTYNCVGNDPIPMVFSDGKILVPSTDGVYEYNAKADTFEPYEPINKVIVRGEPIYFIGQDKKGNIWFEDFDGTGLLTKLPGENYSALKTPFFKLGKTMEPYSVYSVNDSNVIIGQKKGFIHYNPSYTKDYLQQFGTLIRKVQLIENDSLIYDGGEIPATKTLQLPGSFDYKNNSIRFVFAAAFYEDIDKTMYRYMLEGYEKEWSQWTREAKKEYTNLSEGTYTFRVISRNVFRTEGKEATFEFRILPPWYRTLWAYILYILIAGFLIYAIVYLNLRRLKAANIHLENIVKERTAEILQQKEEIQTQADYLSDVNSLLNEKNEEISAQRNEIEMRKAEIEEKNKNITDSILYALRIQMAVLPQDDFIRNLLPNYFILFKPRDIVSGDFYWFAKQDKWIMAAVADCTGHGVPGAFMSMLGISFLNEIAARNETIAPGSVLNELRRLIIKSLQQRGISGEQQDGMDIALCAIDTCRDAMNGVSTCTLQYAGANNPLYVAETRRASSLQPALMEIKADKMPIAFYGTMNDFTNHELQIQSGDMVYLFSDGYIDQFGGPLGKKFLYTHFKEILLSSSSLPLEDQRKQLEVANLEWRTLYEIKFDQTDDITVVGIRI